jgi:hypothetical protein
MRYLLLVIVFTLLLAVLLIAGPNIGDPAPNFTLPDTTYTYHSLSDYQYNVVLVNHGQST